MLLSYTPATTARYNGEDIVLDAFVTLSMPNGVRVSTMLSGSMVRLHVPGRPDRWVPLGHSLIGRLLLG